MSVDVSPCSKSGLLLVTLSIQSVITSWNNFGRWQGWFECRQVKSSDSQYSCLFSLSLTRCDRGRLSVQPGIRRFGSPTAPRQISRFCTNRTFGTSELAKATTACDFLAQQARWVERFCLICEVMEAILFVYACFCKYFDRIFSHLFTGKRSIAAATNSGIFFGQ